MAKKKKINMDLGSTDDVLATLGNFQQNYLKEQTDEQLKRIREVKNEVEDYQRVLKQGKSNKTVKQQKKDLDAILKKATKVSSKDLAQYDISINLMNDNINLADEFKMITSGKGKLFIQQGKDKVEIIRDGNSFSEKITIKKPRKQTKAPKKKKEPVQAKQAEQVAQQSFSYSKDRLFDMLNKEITNQKKLLVKNEDIKQIVTKIKSFSDKKELFRYVISIMSNKKTNLIIKLKGNSPDDQTVFFGNKMDEILKDAFGAEDQKELQQSADRVQQMIKIFQSRKDALQKLTEGEQKFIADIAIIVKEAVARASIISFNKIQKVSSLLNNNNFKNIIQGISGFNPIVGAIYDMVAEKIQKASDKIAVNSQKSGLDKDLENIIEFDEENRKSKINSYDWSQEELLKHNINKPDPEPSMEGEGVVEEVKKEQKKTNETVKDLVGEVEESNNQTIEVLKENQAENIEVLKDLIEEVKDGNDTTENLYQQNKDWKKDEIVQMSKDRIKDENSTFDKVFSTEQSPMEDKGKNNFLSKILGGGLGTLTGSFLTDMLGASFIGGIIKMVIPVISTVALPVLATVIGGYLFKKFVWDKIDDHAKEYESTKTSAFIADITTMIGKAFTGGISIISAKQTAQNLDKTHEAIRGMFDTVFSKEGDSFQDRKLRKLQEELDKETAKLDYAEQYYKGNNYKETDKVGNDSLLEQREKVAQLKKKVGNTNDTVYAMNTNRRKLQTATKGIGSNIYNKLIPSAMGYVPKRNVLSSSLPSNGLTSTIKDKDYKNLTPELRAQIERIAMEEGLDPDLAIEMINQESGFKENALGPMTKYGRAVGRTQLLESTAKDMGLDPFDPEQNLRGGIRYLKKQMDKYGNEAQALSGYNAGPKNTDDAIKAGHHIAPFKETIGYVKNITARLEQRRDAKEAKLAQAGKDRNMQTAMNTGAGNTVINAPSTNVNGGGSTRSGTQLSSRNTESAYVNLQNSMYRGTPMG